MNLKEDQCVIVDLGPNEEAARDAATVLGPSLHPNDRPGIEVGVLPAAPEPMLAKADVPQAAPPSLRKDFGEVIDLGMRDAYYHGQIFRRYQIYLCRNLH